jgi:hypothetical protein
VLEQKADQRHKECPLGRDRQYRSRDLTQEGDLKTRPEEDDPVVQDGQQKQKHRGRDRGGQHQHRAVDPVTESLSKGGIVAGAAWIHSTRTLRSRG